MFFYQCAAYIPPNPNAIICLLASIKSEYRLINDIVSKYEHSMRDDHMTNTTKYIGDFMVVAGVIFASCMGNIFRDKSDVSCGAGT
jgi:hypothetical protein